MKTRKKKYLNSVDFDDYFNKQIENDKEFKKSWNEYKLEFEAMRAVARARAYNNLTQKELAELSGIDQAEISKIEKGTRNPSINLLKRIAEAMNMTLRIDFIPNTINK